MGKMQQPNNKIVLDSEEPSVLKASCIAPHSDGSSLSEKRKESNRKWARKNKTSKKIYDKKRYINEKPKLVQQKKRWYRKNKKNISLKYRNVYQDPRQISIILGRKMKLTGIKISVEEYDKLLVDQKGVCAICNKKCKTGRALAIDHNHKTKKVRGLLCFKCNRGLGCFDDNCDFVLKAYKYLLINDTEEN